MFIMIMFVNFSRKLHFVVKLCTTENMYLVYVFITIYPSLKLQNHCVS